MRSIVTAIPHNSVGSSGSSHARIVFTLARASTRELRSLSAGKQNASSSAVPTSNKIPSEAKCQSAKCPAAGPQGTRGLALRHANLQRHVYVVAHRLPLLLHTSPPEALARRRPSAAPVFADNKVVKSVTARPMAKWRCKPFPLQETPRSLTCRGGRQLPPLRSIGFPPYCW
jgi:hypothetical protein